MPGSKDEHSPKLTSGVPGGPRVASACRRARLALIPAAENDFMLNLKLISHSFYTSNLCTGLG